MKRKTYTKEFKQAAVERVASGESIRSVAREMGTAAASISIWFLKAFGCNYRSFLEDSRVDILKRVAAGDKVTDLAREYRVHRNTIHRWSREAGLSMRYSDKFKNGRNHK